MNGDLAQQSINAALTGDWKKAITVNKQILVDDPTNIDALNRLAHAYSETGKISLARRTAKKVLQIDEFNPIAIKSLARWKNAKDKTVNQVTLSKAELFLEEPGKTKIVHLIHLGDASVIAGTHAGEEVSMNCKGHRISICTSDGKYLGRLADDLSTHLKKMMSYGNQYKAFIKSVDKDKVSVFLRETHQDKKLAHVNSFALEKMDYISFTPPELVHNKDDLIKSDEVEE